MKPVKARIMLEDADELLADCARYLTQFGSVEPAALERGIREWRNEFAIVSIEDREALRDANAKR